MLEALFRQQEGPNGEIVALVQSLRSMPPGQIVRWHGLDGDKTAAQMIEHLDRNDDVGRWYLTQVKAQGWRPHQPPGPEVPTEDTKVHTITTTIGEAANTTRTLPWKPVAPINKPRPV